MSKEYEIILRAVNDNGKKYDLNIVDNVGLRLDISAIESQDIGKIFGISSQTFTLPGTDENNQFFNNVFDLGTTPAVAFNKTAPCQVLVDGAAVFTGRLYITDVVSDQYNDVIYNCVVVNETVDFKTLVENKTLASLTDNWKKYNHQYNWTNVSQSWNDKLFSGSVFYPLINYGSQVNDTTSPAIQFSPNLTTTTGSIDNIATPLKVTQLKPAIQVKTILDEIFNSVNYKYTSSFLNTDYFKSVYMVSTSDEKTGTSFVNQVSQSLLATPTAFQNLPSSGSRINSNLIRYGTEITDDGNNWNTTTSTFTAQVSGSYNVSSGLRYTIGPSFAFGFRSFEWQIRVNGNITRVFSTSLGFMTSGFVSFPQTILNLNAGDTIQIYGRFVGLAPGEVMTIFPGQNNSWLKIIGPPGDYNGIVNIGAVFPPDMKILDFIRGLAEKFNLVIEPVRNQKNILKIETFNDWADQGQIVDWTEIVDRSIKYKVTSPILGQPRNLYFSDALDEDVLNKNYKTAYNKIYGEYLFTTPLDLAVGEKKIGEVFGATPTRYLTNSNTVEVPWLCQEDTSKSLVPFKYKARLLHKTPVVDVPANEAKGRVGNVQGYYFVLDGGTARPVNYYSTALPTYYSGITIVIPGNTRILSQPSSSLHFDSSTYRQFKNTQLNKYIPGAYDNFWSYYVNEIYDIDSRLLTCNIVLKPSEIQNIQLNDKIFIDGHYYRINKINGANLVNTDSIEVELLKTTPRRIPYNGRRRILTPRTEEPNAYVDAIIGSYNPDGTITYVDFETGDVINDVEIISQVVGVDGKDYYTGVVWDNEQTQIYNPNVLTLGVTKYNESLYNVLSIGNGNSITDYSSNVLVMGDNNQVNPMLAQDDATASFDGLSSVTLLANDAIVNESNNIVLIQPSGSRTISGSINNVFINPINDITINDPTGSVYTGNLINQGTADFKNGASLTGSVSITGSLCVNGDCWPFDNIDTGSFLITASYTQPNITFTKGDGSIFNVDIGTNNFATTASFAYAYDTTNQYVTGETTATPMLFNQIVNANNMIITGSKIIPLESGLYNIQFSAQLDKTSSTPTKVYIWLSKDGVDVPNSNTAVSMTGGSNEAIVAAWNFYEQINSGSFVSILWAAEHTNAFIAYNATPPVGPAIPSVILTVNQIK